MAEQNKDELKYKYRLESLFFVSNQNRNNGQINVSMDELITEAEKIYNYLRSDD